MFCDAVKVLVGGEKCQFVPDAKLREQSVDSARLHTRAPANISQFGRLNMILPIRRQEWHRPEMLQDLRARLRPRETLQQFLQHQTRADNRLTLSQSLLQGGDFGGIGWMVPAERERPNAGVDKKAHARERSFL